MHAYYIHGWMSADSIYRCQRAEEGYWVYQTVLISREWDKLSNVIHWDLCKKYGVKVQSKWYDHVPEKVEETDHVNIIWGFKIQTDHRT